MDALRAQFEEEGWCRVDGLLPPETCDAIRQAFAVEVAPYRGELFRQLTSRAEPHERSVDGHVVNPVVNPHQLTGFPTFCQSELLYAPLLVAA